MGARQISLKAYEKLLDEMREDIKKRLIGFNSESREKEFYHSFHDSSTRLIGLKNDLRNLMLNVMSEGERNFFIGTGIAEGGGCYVDFLYLKYILLNGLGLSGRDKARIVSHLNSKVDDKLLNYGLIRAEQDFKLQEFERNYEKILENIIDESVFQRGLPFFLFCRESFDEECKIVSYRVDMESSE